jgi:hypothetical protein
MTDPKKPTGPGGRPLIKLPPGTKVKVVKRAEGPAAATPKPPAPKPPPKPKGPAYTPPRALEPFIERFWMVMRASGRRPKVRHLMLVEAQEEARRIAANNPGVAVWVLYLARYSTHWTKPLRGRG